MVSYLIIRTEHPKDVGAIGALIREAFLGHPHSQGAEDLLVETLRRQSGLTVSLVAEVDGRVAGYIAFSPAYPEDGTSKWFALGPVAVSPGLQRQRIGSLLVAHGLTALEGLRAAGCILVGGARYYSRFGFERMPCLAPPTEPAEHFMVKVLAGPLPTTPVHFHPAFHAAA
jgi:putative acetyltransferase